MSLVRAVLAQAERTPDAEAIVAGDGSWSYRDLVEASARIAGGLRARGLEAGQPIAIDLPRSAELAGVLLGALRLGLVVVPLDRQSPPERRAHMLADSGAGRVIGEADLPGLLAAEPWLELPGEQPISFIFYTSGSTGRPKGVRVRDAGILRLAQPGYLDLSRTARFASMANPAFDAISFEVWAPLLTGGCIVVVPEQVGQRPDRLERFLLEHRIDTVFVTVALFNAVVDEVPHCFAGCDQVLVGGEQLNAPLIRRWYRDNPDCRTQLSNIYGPTEATTFALSHPIPRSFDAPTVPIGGPLAGTTVALVAEDGSAGERGEIWLSGPALAAGYQNRPEETGQRFLRHRDQLWYRTGDLGHRNPDGSISYTGRLDRQLKVRGFRIEPGEIEQQLSAHPGVRQAFVCARRDARGRSELRAYLVTRADLTVAELTDHLAATLPDYLRPHSLYRVPALPLTGNGKVDQAALLADPRPRWQDEPTGASAAGTRSSELETELLRLAGDLLDRRDLSPAHTWLQAGGDSLSALQLRYRVRRRWGSDLSTSTVLTADLGQLADEIAATGIRYPALVRSDRLDGPASSEQQRLWLWQQRQPESCAYNVGFAFEVSGPVDLARLRAAAARLVERYPALRTAFHGTADGLWQRIGPAYDPWLDPEGDWSETSDRWFGRPYDLASGRLLRVGFCPDGPGGVLLLHLHHIAVDGHSVSVLLSALSRAYAGQSGPGAPTPIEFAQWQQTWFDTGDYRRQRDELRSLLPVRAGSATASAGRLDAALRTSRLSRSALDRLVAATGQTRFQLLAGLLAVGLYAVTGRTELALASPVVNRPIEDFTDSVGMFANTMLLPVTVGPARTLIAQLQESAGQLAGILDRQDVALADVVAGGTVPFDYLVVLENTEFGALYLDGCRIRSLWPEPAEAKCDLTLSVIEPGSAIERDDRLECLWEYAPARLSEAQLQAVIDCVERAVRALDQDSAATVLELAGPPIEAGLGDALEPEYATIFEGFARQLTRTPDAPALSTEHGRVSYAELAGYASGLAAELLAGYPQLAQPGPAAVALYLEASVEHVVAVLALAQLNVTIVPLDPSYPAALLAEIVDQVAPVCILTRAGSEAPARLGRGHPIRLSTGSDPQTPQQFGRPLYTLFTSGSTGTPKGVQVWDDTLVNLLEWQRVCGGLAEVGDTQQFSMLSFDVSFQEILGTLVGGGCLHLIRPGWRHDPAALLDQLERAGIRRLHLPFVAVQLLAEQAVHLGRYPSGLREVVTAGEQLICTEAIRTWFAGLTDARLFNHYGPTETHVVSSLELAGDPMVWPDRPAIGRPVANCRLLLLDDDDQPVPAGVSGRLLIGGRSVRRCYLAPDDSRFLDRDGTFFRSGDLARFDPDGALHYLGRDDEQIKLSGHRLELGEVEAALLRHPAVRAAVVVADGEQLVAGLDCPDRVPSASELTEHLAGLLPSWLRVARFRRLAELPRTPSGKLDRRRVLTTTGTELAFSPAGPAETALEADLASLFSRVVGRPIEADQRFFDAGATSLDLMRFQLRCSTELALPVTIPALFEHVTVRRLARSLEIGSGERGETEPAEPADQDGKIAIVGMAVRLPGADDLASFWRLVVQADTGIEYFDAADGLVGARSQLADPLGFDPDHFGLSPAEARLMDPQQRHLLMACEQALAHAGLADPAASTVGLIASCGENTYFQSMLREADPAALPDGFQLALHHDKDFLATKAAYHLGLTGPAFTVQAACSSSLVAVHLAAGLLRTGEAEVMLAGGVLVDPTLTAGYRYRPQHIFSADGYCRPFSDDAGGTIGGSGVAVVVLKSLAAARRDGDEIHAVVAGSAVNNDGSGKLSYSAPSVAGQRAVVQAALARSGHSGAEVGYVEAHGTATALGDPVELTALRQAFAVSGPAEICQLSSVKSQVGHLGAAAGVVGLIRAALAVRHGVRPPSLGFRRLNPRLGSASAPFTVSPVATPWPPDRPRVAGVSSFGIGGTNAHVILEAGPAAGVRTELPATELVLTASSPAALRAEAARIADYLQLQPDQWPWVQRHLRFGRPVRRFRIRAQVPDVTAAIHQLRSVADPVIENAQLAQDDSASTGRPAPPPWDFPPPGFQLADYDFERATAATTGPWPVRQPEPDWLRQPAWTRWQRSSRSSPASVGGVLIYLSAEPVAELVLEPFRSGFARVVGVVAGEEFGHQPDGSYLIDPADPASIGRLLTEVARDQDVSWLHALPLAVTGPVSQSSLERARRAGVETAVAVVQAGQFHRIRPYWLTAGAQPVRAGLERPEFGLLAGITEVAPQETRTEGCWLDLPTAEPRHWSGELAALLAADQPDRPRRLALRDGFWWRPVLVPVPPPAQPAVPAAGTYLILGGTGGIGTAIAAELLADPAIRVLLLARRPVLPPELAAAADRVGLIAADLTREPLADLDRRITAPALAGIVHAAGVGHGGVIALRPTSAPEPAATLQGALLMERLIARYRPEWAVYCSSMASLRGGAGQLDYVAANGVLDSFAHHRSGPEESTARIAIDWDVWREAGLATATLTDDPRHQAHLRTGLSVAEGRRVFGQSLALQLPQLAVCTTDHESTTFYRSASPSAQVTETGPAEDPSELLAGKLAGWLGVIDLDPAAALYELGADSLTMLDLIGEIKDRWDVDLELSEFGAEVSLNEVLARVQTARTNDPAAGPSDIPIELWQAGTGESLLVLIHPVGGDIQAYRPLAAALDPAVTLALIADPGLRHGTEPGWTLRERAGKYLAALDRRFPHRQPILAGWSFGAWLACEMAELAEAAGRTPPGLHLIDPPAPDAHPAAYDTAALESLFAHELAGNREPNANASAYAARLARCCRANLAAMAGHRLAAPGGPAVIWLAGRPETGLPAPPPADRTARAWRDHLPGPVTLEVLDTTHYGIVRSPQAELIAGSVSAPTALVGDHGAR